MLYFVKPELNLCYAPSRLPVSVTQKEKSKGICMEGYPEKNSLFYHSSTFTINPQALHRSLRSIAALSSATPLPPPPPPTVSRLRRVTFQTANNHLFACPCSSPSTIFLFRSQLYFSMITRLKKKFAVISI